VTNGSAPGRGLRALPTVIDGYGAVEPFVGGCAVPPIVLRPARPLRPVPGHASKRLGNLDAAFEACGIGDGATLSFHHHLRNGDQVLNQVLEVAARRGLRGLTVAASSLFPVHAPLVGHIERGVVARIVTAYMTGPVADAVSAGLLPLPAVLQTHGGRAAAIESGRLPIDVAFIAAPAADDAGNLSGAIGRAACGPLGYAMVDAEHATRVVAVTDTLRPFPAAPIDITQDRVDFVVVVGSIGDPAGILSGTTRPTADPHGLHIANTAAQVIDASGLLGTAFSFQTGAGGVSLAVAQELAKLMQRRGVQGSFASGGVTGSLCDMLEAGLFRTLFDVQCFDLKAVDSYRRDPRHLAMSASLYANPHARGAIVDRLGAMVLGAAEVDLDFNVNVSTGSDGRILGGSGGHADTADGAALAIVTTRLVAGAVPKIVERVRCVTTPGSTIDVVVTEAGVAVHPGRPELAGRLRGAGLRLRTIDELRDEAARLAPPPPGTPDDGGIVAVVEYRDGTVIDVIRRTACR
jgi:citrate lyase subunit alpha/citrate CoA-transferase